MRKLSCWLIIAILTIHMSVYSMDYSNDTIDFEDENLESISPQISESSHNHQTPCHDYDGFGGPAWLVTDSYSTGDIVEYPSNSGNYYILYTANVTNMNETDSPESDLWSGPCTCSEIASSGNVPTWDFSTTYAPWQIVEHNGAYWIAQELGALVEEEPGNEGASGSPNDYWKPCSSHCSTWTNSADGMGGPVWQNGNVYYLNEIVEWPANSGQFWQMTFNGSNDPPEAVQDGDWIGPCTCVEIGMESGITWDATMTYDPWQIVEHNGAYWIAQELGALELEEPGNEGASGSSQDYWKPCSGPCSTFNGSAGPVVWDSTASYSVDDTVEWPANSGQFWQSTTSGPTGEPNPNGKWTGPCSCKDIWADSTSSVWDSNTVYDAGMLVEFPAGSGDIWMAITPSTTAGVDPTFAWADDNEWELCSSDDGGPCAGLEVVGVWDATLDGPNLDAGDIYEYPANSGTLYQVNLGGGVTGFSPENDSVGWTPIDCPCEETWDANGQPVWDGTVFYLQNDVVEWPAGSGILYIAEGDASWVGSGAGTETPEPSTDDYWIPCKENQSSGGPCAGLEVVGVWDATLDGPNLDAGDIYEYPANSGTLYQVNLGGGVTGFSPENDSVGWTPIDCPCKETWDANGQPVWDISTTYWLDEVVEWPAGSGDLWIAIDNGFESEPSLSALDWIPCEETPSDGGPCAGLTVVGVWDSTMNVTSGEIYEYPANSGTLYQVNPGGPFWSVSAPDIDLDVWSPIDCPCKETWVANGQPVWVAGTAYPGNYVVEWPAGTGNLYVPLEPTGVSTGAGEPGIDIHWILCDGQGPSPGPCDGLNVSVWDNTTTPAVGDIYEYPANSGTYYEIYFTHEDANGGPDWVANPVQQGADEFWKPHTCPCKETWDANGQPVWDSTVVNYAGNYVVEWPASSGILYISEGGGITGAGEPGIDGHWIPCEGNSPLDEASPDKEKATDGLPSIGAFATLLGILAASAFVRREREC